MESLSCVRSPAIPSRCSAGLRPLRSLENLPAFSAYKETPQGISLSGCLPVSGEVGVPGSARNVPCDLRSKSNSGENWGGEVASLWPELFPLVLKNYYSLAEALNNSAEFKEFLCFKEKSLSVIFFSVFLSPFLKERVMIIRTA